MRDAKGMAWAIAGAGLLTLIFTASVMAKKGGLPPGQAKKKGYHHAPAPGEGKPHHAPARGKAKRGHTPAPGKVRPAYKGGPPPWAPAHGYRAKYKYRYYPGHQVYFDPVRAHYFWFSAGTWLSGPALPPAIVLPPTGFVTLGMDVRNPFEFHREIVTYYPAYESGPPPWAPAHGRRAKYRYYYYPGYQVYFDPVRAHYFWFSAGTWLSGPTLPPAIVLPPSGFVTLGMDVPKPFEFHKEVIIRFPVP